METRVGEGGRKEGGREGRKEGGRREGGREGRGEEGRRGEEFIGVFTLDLFKLEALSNRCKVNYFNAFTLVYLKCFRLSECKCVMI